MIRLLPCFARFPVKNVNHLGHGHRLLAWISEMFLQNGGSSSGTALADDLAY